MEKNKKINIITRHNIVNYGSFFQTLATQYFFENLGYKTNIINYISKEETVLGNIKTNAKKRKRFIKKMAYIFLKTPEELIKNYIFKKKTRKYLHLSRRYKNSDELEKENFDGFVCVGSDQVWGYMPNGKIDSNYFGVFCYKNILFSYSASFGRLNYNDYEVNKMKNYLNKFSFITVREENSVSFIKEKMGLDAYFILDPTLMLNKNIWNNLLIETDEKNYILVYQLRKNKEMDKIIEQYSKNLGIKVIKISTSLFDKKFKRNNKILIHPYKVLGFFKNASLIITDSFHATVFSIVFQKNFVVYLPPETSMRITNILNSLNINGNIVKEYNKLVYPKIDYLDVDRRLEEIRRNKTTEIKKMLDELEEKYANMRF